MINLTETQRTILAAAAIRPGMRILPLPERIKGGAVTKVLTALAARGLVEVTAARPGEPTVRDGVTLVLTAAAFAALGIALPTDGKGNADAEDAVVARFNAGPGSGGEPAGGAPTGADEAQVAATPKRRGRPQPAAPTEPVRATTTSKLRAGTKQAQLIAMLEAPEGATIAEIAEALEWAHHTVRGAIAGALKKRLGLNVTSETNDARGRIYRIA